MGGRDVGGGGDVGGRRGGRRGKMWEGEMWEGERMWRGEMWKWEMWEGGDEGGRRGGRRRCGMYAVGEECAQEMIEEDLNGCGKGEFLRIDWLDEDKSNL